MEASRALHVTGIHVSVWTMVVRKGSRYAVPVMEPRCKLSGIDFAMTVEPESGG